MAAPHDGHREIQLVLPLDAWLPLLLAFHSSRNEKPCVCGIFLMVFEHGSNLIIFPEWQIRDLAGKGLEVGAWSGEQSQ